MKKGRTCAAGLPGGTASAAPDALLAVSGTCPPTKSQFPLAISRSHQLCVLGQNEHPNITLTASVSPAYMREASGKVAMHTVASGSVKPPKDNSHSPFLSRNKARNSLPEQRSPALCDIECTSPPSSPGTKRTPRGDIVAAILSARSRSRSPSLCRGSRSVSVSLSLLVARRTFRLAGPP